MEQLSLYWMTLETRRKALFLGGLAALVVVLIILSRLATTPSYVLLYSGLEPTAAGEVIAALEARGVAHSIRGDAIYVDQSRRDELRMSLAGEGLPANGAAGYELLDSLSGFGTTSQMFDAAYWRAKEGELARTILASPQIRAARVHLANPGNDPFQDRAEVTASVAVRPAAGGIGAGHARALRFLVASSVPGLLPENVTVIDADSGQIIGASELDMPGADAANRSEELRRNIERLLAARVGRDNAVVEVSVDLNTAHETIVERRIDPESRIIIATDTEEMSNSSSDAASGAVTVASNLPDGDAAGDGQSSRAETSETRERVTFDVSETQREIELEPGGIRRISVAVLVNGVPRVNADGLEVIEPRDPEEIDALEQLVRSAIGYDAERGDQVTIRSMAFEVLPAGELIEGGGNGLLAQLDMMRLAQLVILAAVALAIAFGLIRPILSRPPMVAPEGPRGLPLTPALSQGALVPTQSAMDGTTSTQVLGYDPSQSPSGSSGSDGAAADAEAGTPGLPAVSTAVADPVERLRRLIEEREDETVEILRGWMEEDEEPA
ncbi:flagellar M-ring protein FliF [Rhodophyticola porphyridii]|uniref:Flagellar M-ring protein n=1 Tax=Rhodophyticola porphyridii TaxID=1852017 RepID=A0A3L9Y623_9RHOB|nr:flagellar M-ring protein FliF [Rhodophyticola porphyridii]